MTIGSLWNPSAPWPSEITVYSEDWTIPVLFVVIQIGPTEQTLLSITVVGGNQASCCIVLGQVWRPELRPKYFSKDLLFSSEELFEFFYPAPLLSEVLMHLMSYYKMALLILNQCEPNNNVSYMFLTCQLRVIPSLRNHSFYCFYMQTSVWKSQDSPGAEGLPSIVHPNVFCFFLPGSCSTFVFIFTCVFQSTSHTASVWSLLLQQKTYIHTNSTNSLVYTY